METSFVFQGHPQNHLVIFLSLGSLKGTSVQKLHIQEVFLPDPVLKQISQVLLKKVLKNFKLQVANYRSFKNFQTRIN